MKNFDSLVDIWQAQKSGPQIDYKHIITHFKKSKNKFIIKLSLGLISMAIVLLIIIILWLKTPFTYSTTHISLFIFVLCCLYYIALQIKNLRILSAPFCIETPKKHIQQLQKFKQLRHKQNTRNYFFYTIAMGLGFALYFIEFFAQVNGLVILLSLAFTVVWFTLCYFYLQKIYIKREDKAITQMLEDLDRIKNQFK
ncbi:MAG: hypothetical protein EAY66_04350 [Sphingobacteriales bacterium]|nr:MAG: hypothetical protein EAY66_04350 [Sphingobacteriales bacterium]